jgi:hypothetical protein
MVRLNRAGGARVREILDWLKQCTLWKRCSCDGSKPVRLVIDWLEWRIRSNIGDGFDEDYRGRRNSRGLRWRPPPMVAVAAAMFSGRTPSFLICGVRSQRQRPEVAVGSARRG